MIDIKKITGPLTGIKYKTLITDVSFLETASGFAGEQGTTLLMSGGDLDCARYHILGIRPWFFFSGKDRFMTVSARGEDHRFEANPFDVLKEIKDSFKFDDQVPENIPIASGLLGYLSYDLKDCLEELPRTSVDDLNLPDIYMNAPSVILVYDKLNSETTILVSEINGKALLSLEEAEVLIRQKSSHNTELKDTEPAGSGKYVSNFIQKDYESAIDKIREYIAAGHVYQVNMTQRFEMEFSDDPFKLFTRLYERNPAPFFAYINAGDHHIVSTSPERFLTLKGNYIETRPIKGTKPRGKTEEEDLYFRELLENSKKDEAELSMIVDLMRNDIGKVCEASSVKVKEHKRLEAYENVYHLVSIVEGTLKEECDEVDLLKATFPGGSITGCPKIRSMEIIDELEPNRRHVYTGSIGYISFHNSMDLSIAIRTAIISNGRVYFSFGGGVVYDSDPLDEYTETLHKGKTIMETLSDDKTATVQEQKAWINGSVKPLSDIKINFTDLGLQYGYGFFETIRADNGKILFLDDHIKRFNHTWKTLFKRPVPDITWDSVIQQVLEENRMNDAVAAVKIMATYGDRDKPPFNHNLIVTARKYTHRLEAKKENFLRLGTYHEPRQSPLADHKTLNYLYCLTAGKWAKDNGFDEALIMNPDNSLSETNTANIFIIRDNRVIKPQSAHVLAGVMEKNICRFFESDNYSIDSIPLEIKDLKSSDMVFISNSLIGAVPVKSIDDNEFADSNSICIKINKALGI